MVMIFCDDCQRYHAEGMCEADQYHAPESGEPQSEPKRARRMPSMSLALDEWTAIYEQNLAEFATENNGVPTKAMIKRAEQIADREIKRHFEQERTP